MQVRSVDEMNHDFQALALEGRGMGEVSWPKFGILPLWLLDLEKDLLVFTIFLVEHTSCAC